MIQKSMSQFEVIVWCAIWYHPNFRNVHFRKKKIIAVARRAHA